MSHETSLDAKFLASLAVVDAAAAERVHKAGCTRCGGPLDRADYPRKPRGDLGESAGAYERRLSFCCRCDGCRRRATPPSLRFFGRRVYIAVLVILASAAGTTSRRRPVHGVPARTVRRWLHWWRAVLVLSAFWREARSLFATPVDESVLPGSLLARLGEGASAVGKALGLLAPLTTASVVTRMAMVG